jgi:hypothetical protein
MTTATGQTMAIPLTMGTTQIMVPPQKTLQTIAILQTTGTHQTMGMAMDLDT